MTDDKKTSSDVQKAPPPVDVTAAPTGTNDAEKGTTEKVVSPNKNGKPGNLHNVLLCVSLLISCACFPFLGDAKRKLYGVCVEEQKNVMEKREEVFKVRV